MKGYIGKLLGKREPEPTVQKPRAGAVQPSKPVKRDERPSLTSIIEAGKKNITAPAQAATRQVAVQEESAKHMDAVPVKKAQSTGSRNIEANKAQIDYILNFDGEVVTGHGGLYEITEKQMLYVALLAHADPVKNVLVVSKNHNIHHETSSVRSRLRQSGVSWRTETLVDLEVIRKLYENSTSGQNKFKKTEVANMEKEFINLLRKAASFGASDIHINVGRFEAPVRFRIDGAMVKVDEFTSVVASELCQAAFAMADASDPTYMLMEYQGARVTEISLRGQRFPDGVQAVRLQFNPSAGGGRYLVARLLYAQKVGSTSDVDELGYAPIQVKQIRQMRAKTHGINIISGPTGSGKSTTLQRGLTALLREKPRINLITIEDPPEYIIEGAAQLPVTNAQSAEERSEKFRQAITAALRSDPDVIMIGEIRDHASAQLAFEGAMTGHGVWASLHANDGPSILDRLRDQRVESYKIADSTLVTGLVGQRLLRKNIEEHQISFNEALNLKMIDDESAELWREYAGRWLSSIKFAGTHLFPEDNSKAYAGRSVVAEVILPDQVFLDYIKNEEKPKAVKHWLDNLNGMTMLEHAFTQVCNGKLDPRELEEKIGPLSGMDLTRVDRVMELASEK